MNNQPTHESDDVMARRAEMLPGLIAEMERVHARRRSRRRAISAATLVIIVTALALRIPFAPHSPTESVPDSGSRIEFVSTAPGVTDRYVVTATASLNRLAAPAPRVIVRSDTPAPRLVQRIDSDTSLIGALADAGHATGLLRDASGVRLMNFDPASLRLGS